MSDDLEIDVSDLIGKPWKDLGRGPDGYDCWGVCIEAARRLGRELMDYGDICFLDTAKILAEYKIHQSMWEKTEDPMPGDMVVLRGVNGGMHFGIMVSRLSFIHCVPDLGICRERIDHPIRKKLIKEIVRCSQ
jgi:cell wall-associated NlpC family hydrolase